MYLHFPLLFVSGRLDFGESSSLVNQSQCSRRGSIAAPGRPFDGPTAAALWRAVRAGPGDVQLARGDRRTHGPRHFHLVLHDVSHHTISSLWATINTRQLYVYGVCTRSIRRLPDISYLTFSYPSVSYLRRLSDHNLKLTLTRGGFRHVQHVRPNRGPHKKGAPTKAQYFFHFLQHGNKPEILK